MSVSDRELEKINNKLNRLAETVDNNKNTTNTIYKLVEKQDYNSERSRRWLSGIALLSLGFLVGHEQYESTWEQVGMFLIIVALFYGYVTFCKD